MTSGDLNPSSGLTAAEVAQRTADGQINRGTQRSSRTVGEIVRANVFTRFNAIVATLMTFVIALGEWRDALFGFVMILNLAIGVVQEWRAKITLDRLSLISASSITVWRDGVRRAIASHDVVVDDVFELAPGDQIVVDGVVLDADGLALDESLLTGESIPVDKAAGDGVLSGSFVVAGGGLARAVAVGEDSYAARLTTEAKRFKAPKSDTAKGIDRILQFVTWAIAPAALMLFFGQRAAEDESLEDTLMGTVAGVVALVPQGLVLLLSMAQTVAVIRLGRKQVLVQRLQAVETLARVTVLAADKTGTLTTGEVALRDLELLDGDGGRRVDGTRVAAALTAVAAADEHPNATMRAIQAARPTGPGWPVVGRIPFDSSRKYSAVDFDSNGVWFLGAPEVLLRAGATDRRRIEQLAGEGHRVLLLAEASTMPASGRLPEELSPVALVVFSDEIRPDAAATIDYFLREHVQPKVISGDNPLTVSTIARRCHVPGAERFIDGRELPSEPDALVAVATTAAVFGRVTPEAKRVILQALQDHGEVVAMTGDGVNDTLALKDADLGIAMGSGTPATKAVSDLVLLDNRFATLPSVVGEGRRVIANIERVARLFLTKTVWAAVLAVLTGVLLTPYPLRPRHLTVVDALTIGIPGVVLSFQPSHDPVRPGFIRRVLRFSIPVGVVVGLATMSVNVIGHRVLELSDEATQSGTTAALTALGLWTLYELARPLDPLRAALIAVLVLLGIGAFAVPLVADFFLLEIPEGTFATWIVAIVGTGCVLISIALRAVAPRPADPDVP